MIGISVDQKSLNSFIKDLKKMGHIISSPNLQLYRAKKFRKYTIDKVRSGELGLVALSGATRIISGDHTPEDNKGGLINQIGVRPAKNNEAEAGYFESNKKKIPGKKITYTEAAIMQHTGYRINLSGDKGAKARAWVYARLAEAGYSPIKSFHKLKSDDKWFIVPARPFVFISADNYIGSDEDIIAADEFLDKMLMSPIMEDKD